MEKEIISESSRTRMDYYSKEQLCENLFKSGGPYWHLCSPGNLSGIIFRNDEQLKLGVSNMAMCAAEYSVRILTDAIMNNHIHGILEGEKAECEELFNKFKTRLVRYLSSQGLVTDLSSFNCSLFPIDDLRTMRYEIAYVNRNGYVINNNYTPFTYPWGSGYLYFNYFAQSIQGKPFNSLGIAERRTICHSRTIKMPDNYRVSNGMILPSSYCRYEKGEKFYRDAHQYFQMVSRNAEAYSLVAKQLSDGVFLTDDEMYSAVCQVAIKNFNTRQPSLLQPKAKLEMAKIMHIDYNASNGQIKRILRLEQQVVDELYPLRSKR